MSNSQQADKKIYDDISFEKRKQLIHLINERKWTIKAAAQELDIKLCTAKYILYLYRKHGKIYRKKVEQRPQPENKDEQSPQNTIYVPYPYYVFCFCTPDQIPISLEHLNPL